MTPKIRGNVLQRETQHWSKRRPKWQVSRCRVRRDIQVSDLVTKRRCGRWYRDVRLARLAAASDFYRAMLCIRCTSHGPVSVRLCPSVTSWCSIETVERMELVFGMWASFHPSYIVLEENPVISKNKGTSLWNFVLNFGLSKFLLGISIVETCYQLSSRKVDAQSVINWAVVGQLSR